MFSPQRPPTITVDPADGSQGTPDAENNVAQPLTEHNSPQERACVSPAAFVQDPAGAAVFSPSSYGGSTATGMTPDASTVERSRAASLNTTLSSIPSHENLAGARQDDMSSGFPFLPEILADMVSSKSMADLEAVGGPAGLSRGLRTDLDAGLGSGESRPNDVIGSAPQANDVCDVLKARKAVFGTNRIPDKKLRGIFDLMILALSDRVLILLSVVAAISLSVGMYQSFGQPHAPGQPRVEWVDGVTIMAAVMIVVVTGAANDYQKERQFARLNKKKEQRAVVAIRSGKPTEISVFDILAGDVLQLNPGDLVPADGILIAGHAIHADESSMTGESEQIKKTPAAKALTDLRKGRDANGLDPFIISGSKILEGTGTYLRPDATPLQEKLSGVADKIAISGVAVATVLFLVLTIKLIFTIPTSDSSPFELLQTFLRIFIVSITIVVIAVPEGLPLAVTLALSIAVTRMLKDNNLVRILAACETMGNATTVCCDKTGTLTMNKMRVTRGVLGNTAASEHDALLGGALPVAASDDVRDAMLKSIAINSTAFEGDEDGSIAFIGSKTEASLLLFAKDWLGMQPLQQERANAEVVEVYPFDSTRKCMATVTRLPDSKYRIYVKGAPEVLLEYCSRVIPQAASPLGQGVSLTEERRDVLLGTIGEYASHSLRVLGFAYKDTSCWPPFGYPPDGVPVEQILADMTLLGVLGIQDSLRPGVADAVARCQGAGVFVRMVTGDNVRTARAIASQCGILTDHGIVLEGPAFRQLSDTEMDRILSRLQVLARSSPEDKQLLVKRLKELGETVAVTGDGTNDGPALRAADVGFSMGLSGTDIAKEASSIVLMDDNFSSIVKVIEWGRTVNDAVKKFLNFQLTVNITAVTVTFVSAIISDKEESILTPVQLLPTKRNRSRKKARKKIRTINIYNRMEVDYRPIEEMETLETLIFNAYVWMQFFNLYNNRRLDNKFNVFQGITMNPYFIAIIVAIAAGQFLIITFGGSALSATQLSAKEWAISLILGVLCMPVAMVLRLIPDESIKRLFDRKRHGRSDTPQGDRTAAPTDEIQWPMALRRVRCELLTIRQPRSSRLQRLRSEIGDRAISGDW
ncbi:haloacid dehalogenase-like hydrolase [Hirsutella rhossiliensis]|uniref:Calcium-transporting ATPase n=1 Tax=Hirsutella rhossiliensis TaxID=111463 RepID=A0A9P8N8E8_9HYPO|nr:haloacid dehalogenase-like hydrolase domain-containing protein [Hirsutella rhossiliensis]KAH0967886.1 haloacid dehalogenase-like hydrolase domain-containing protein [Hirsutella rhossiliensis]